MFDNKRSVNIQIVIGANFGDEGKGLMVDYFTGKMSTSTCVVRFNGGAQAGHTVTAILPNDKRWRHVFHHIGSGAFNNAETFLTEHFILNPFLWRKEHESLPPSFHKKWLKIHHDAIITTPYDMLLNVELSKPGTTCGVGINETIQRNKVIPIKASEMRDLRNLKEKLNKIRTDYINSRLKETSHTPSKWFIEKVESEELVDNWIKALIKMEANSMITGYGMLKTYGNLVFEGAQGLLLDQDSPFFPHVTHSKTGLHNVKHVLNQLSLTERDTVSVTYVTRCYMTRHGEGPFPTEDTGMIHTDITNQPNKFQGKLRFGGLDLDLMKEAILNDIRDYLSLPITYTLDQIKDHVREKYGPYGMKFNVALTCINQLNNQPAYVKMDGENKRLWSNELCLAIGKHIGIPVKYQGFGQTKDKINYTASYDLDKITSFTAHP